MHRYGSATIALLILFVAALAQAAPPSYDSSLNEGRKLTRAGKHAEAITALDEALAARPGDPTALAARGFARLSSVPKDAALTEAHRTALAAARADFDAALAKSTDEALSKRVRHNLGLVAQRLGGAGTGCGVTIEKKALGTVYRDWAAVRAGLARLDAADVSPTTDSATPEEDLCMGRCARPAAAVTLQGMDGLNHVVYIQVPKKGIWAAMVGEAWREYQCMPDGKIEVEPLGAYYRIRGTLEPPVLGGVNDKGEECDPEAGEGECMRGCMSPDAPQIIDLVVDPATSRAVSLSYLGSAPSVSVDGSSVKVGSCPPASHAP
jgi:hypothetical protein